MKSSAPIAGMEWRNDNRKKSLLAFTVAFAEPVAIVSSAGSSFDSVRRVALL